ncbi:MAG: hypothetical protein WBQ37_10965 [Candidatus Competibacter sp.]
MGSNAYEAAKAGGLHEGLWKNYRNRPTAMLERAIKSLEQRIAEHEAKIARPQDFLRSNIPEIQIRHLVTIKWPEEIETFKTQIQILKGINEEKTRGGTG